VKSLAELAALDSATVLVRRIGEPVQVDQDALGLLTSAGLLPGQRIEVRRQDGRIIAVREGAEEATGVSLPDDVAAHVFAAVL
jgi:DtxR family Mn-dependent transcriptional regulator